MTDILALLRDEDPEVPWTGPDGLFRQAAAEIDRLRRGFMRMAQFDNGCAQTGLMCREKCSCAIEAASQIEIWCEDVHTP